MSHDLDVIDPSPPDGLRAPTLFEQRVVALLEEHERARAERLRAVSERMAEREGTEHVFAELKPLLRDRLVRPRMEALVRGFPHGRLDDLETPVGVHTRLVLEHTDRFPVKATVTAGALLDANRGVVQIFTKVELVPLLVAVEPSASRDMTLEALAEFARADAAGPDAAGPDAGSAEAARAIAEWHATTNWVDTQLLSFLQVYLGTETDARYQQMVTHIDPVCGMKVAGGGATARQLVRGHAYFFCSTACADRFAADPEYYVNCRHEHVGA